ncbi:MAG TPA: SPOR domain-containing protein [Steroidobacteraceae bacterium]|nr:SPOR domain-containing protein [Steroidobacteraceae bacterium]
MESRAKQRLTGAVILVALFVLLVPELLTGPRDSHPPAAANDEDGLRSYTIELEGRDGGAPPATPPANTGAVTLPAIPPPATSAAVRAVPGEAATPEATTRPSAQNPAATTPAATAPLPTAARPNNEPAASASHPAPAQTTQPAQSGASRPAPAPAAKPPAGNFVVQLGTFSQRDNADRLVRDMTAKGFVAFVVPITSNGHELYRVRVGPTRDRASAEALAAQLKRMGQSGTVVPVS